MVFCGCGGGIAVGVLLAWRSILSVDRSRMRVEARPRSIVSIAHSIKLQVACVHYIPSQGFVGSKGEDDMEKGDIMLSW